MKSFKNVALTGRKGAALKVVTPNDEMGEPDLRELLPYDLLVSAGMNFPPTDDRGQPQAYSTLRTRDEFLDSVEEQEGADEIVIKNAQWNIIEASFDRYVKMNWTLHARVQA